MERKKTSSLIRRFIPYFKKYKWILALDLFMQGPTARVKDFAVSKIKLLGADK